MTASAVLQCITTLDKWRCQKVNAHLWIKSNLNYVTVNQNTGTVHLPNHKIKCHMICSLIPALIPDVSAGCFYRSWTIASCDYSGYGRVSRMAPEACLFNEERLIYFVEEKMCFWSQLQEKGNTHDKTKQGPKFWTNFRRYLYLLLFFNLLLTENNMPLL